MLTPSQPCEVVALRLALAFSSSPRSVNQVRNSQYGCGVHRSSLWDLLILNIAVSLHLGPAHSSPPSLVQKQLLQEMVIRYTGLPDCNGLRPAEYPPVFTCESGSESSIPPGSRDGQPTPSPSSAAFDVGGDGYDVGDERLDNNTPTDYVDDDDDDDDDDDEYKQLEGHACTRQLLVRVCMDYRNCAVKEQQDYAVSSSTVATDRHLSTDADVSSALMATPPARSPRWDRREPINYPSIATD